MPRIKETSPALITSILALVAAVAGTAVAGPVAITAKKDKVTKREKRKIRKVADKRIAKAESSLNVNSAKSAETATSATTAQSAQNATSAQNAASAQNATNATNAGNADTLDGLNASAFTPAGEVHTPSRFPRNDTVSGNFNHTVFNLLSAGPFTIQGRCRDNYLGDDNAQLRVLAPGGTSFWGIDHGTPVGVDSSNDQELTSADANNNASQVRGGHLVAAAPTGQTVSVSASVEIGDGAADCIFGVTVLGP